MFIQSSSNLGFNAKITCGNKGRRVGGHPIGNKSVRYAGHVAQTRLVDPSGQSIKKATFNNEMSKILSQLNNIREKATNLF